MFLSLKRDLAKFRFHPLALPSFSVIYLINRWHYYFFLFNRQCKRFSLLRGGWTIPYLSPARQKASLPTLRKPLLTLRISLNRPFFT